jgi:hypothetical protein
MYATAEQNAEARKHPSLIQELDECRRAYCIKTLELTGGNLSEAARIGGINRQYLTLLIKRYDLTKQLYECRRATVLAFEALGHGDIEAAARDAGVLPAYVKWLLKNYGR